MAIGYLGLNGQNLQIMPPGISLPNVYTIGSTFSFDFKLKKTSGQTVTGSFRTMMSVNGSTAFMVDSVQASVAQNGNGNTFDIEVDSVPVTSPPFIQGANGVVVWVIDDNFNPITEFDTNTIVYSTQPGLMLTPGGLINFPSNPETFTPYDLRFEVTNYFDQDYEDTLFVNIWAAGHYFRLPTAGKVEVKSEQSKQFDIEHFEFIAPPWELGFNPVQIWVDGIGAVALDTVETSLDLTGTVGLSPGLEPAVIGMRNPTHGPVVIRTRADIEVLRLDLYDLTGKLVLRHADAGLLDLADTSLQDGMYWVSAHLSDGSMYRAKLLFVR